MHVLAVTVVSAVFAFLGNAFFHAVVPRAHLPQQAAGLSARALLGAHKAEDRIGAEAARERFLRVLEEKGGDWRNPAVAEELSRLEEANPTEDSAFSGAYLDADWLQVSRPDYAIGDGNTVYTLGKLSFNMYEPKDMKFRVDRTTQVVAPLTGGNGTRRWDISMDLTCVDERYPPFRAKMTTYGQISPARDKEGRARRLDVSFTGGDLKPAPGTDAEMRRSWLHAFGRAQREKRRTLGSLLKNGLLRLMMGLRPPESVGEDGTVAFEMRKPPHGYTDILYLDDRLRVTRGNRGSIVAVTRGAP